jgi:cell division protein FtsW
VQQSIVRLRAAAVQQSIVRLAIKTISAIASQKAPIALTVVVCALVALGVVMLMSASAFSADRHVQDSLRKQLLCVGIGAAGMVVAALLDYRVWRDWWKILFIVSVALLVVVLIPHIGLKVNGARRWLPVGLFRLQPSELAKLAVIIFLANWYAVYQRRLSDRKLAYWLPLSGLGAVVALVIAEPDYGTAALIGMVGLAVMFVAGAGWKRLVPTLLVCAAAFSALVLLSPHRMTRLMAFANLEQHREGAGYQLWQSLLALGSGGVQGVGLGNSRQKFGFLPEAHTDFIFAVIGEELGLIGALLVVMAFVLVLVCGVSIALDASDTFGSLLALGITLMLTVQAAINVGVVTGVLPTKGLALPFISAGGSNLVVTLVAVGILLSVARCSVRESERIESDPADVWAPLGV